MTRAVAIAVGTGAEKQAVCSPAGVTVRGASALALSIAAAALHIPSIGSLTGAERVAVVVLAAGCVWCGVHLVRKPTARAWATAATMSTLMVSVHLSAMGSGHSAHHGTHTAAPDLDFAASSMSSSMQLSLLLALVELGFTGSMLWISTPARDESSLSEGTDPSRAQRSQ
ncbi:MAG: hypothetical protein WBD41_29755 [Rhodococcus sp. (in: high G+C Gram-positive bacteria)]|jgi:hypothetical protein|uniref:hypothetical protein n=1 Tax=Rhodococcus sp. EPR-157 TaxID=1813677 RepID=UPI0007BADFC5|nr:hypothetical protein [Rhodococcus sp. EPR-157]KZF12360.1 hypothetical protein A2J03_18165 [Rhodococcus sp. EPR-157]